MSTYESGCDAKLGYNRNAFQTENKPPQLVLIGKTVKLVAAPIGLVSEAIHNYRDKMRAKSDAITSAVDTPVTEENVAEEDAAYVNLPPEQADEPIASGQAVAAEGQEPTHELVPTYELGDDENQDAADWALDDATEDVERQTDLTALEKLSYGETRNDSKAISAKASYLPYPVILPQRRPGNKTRGFVRAYAPVLQDVGIERDQFLTFIKELQKHSQA
jgi:hypothetical protein